MYEQNDNCCWAVVKFRYIFVFILATEIEEPAGIDSCPADGLCPDKGSSFDYLKQGMVIKEVIMISIRNRKFSYSPPPRSFIAFL